MNKPITVDMALLLMRAVGCQPVYSQIRRRGKTYRLWADRRSHRKIIACWRLEQMCTVEFVAWLKERYPLARILFPVPEVYREKREKEKNR